MAIRSRHTEPTSPFRVAGRNLYLTRNQRQICRKLYRAMRGRRPKRGEPGHDQWTPDVKTTRDERRFVVADLSSVFDSGGGRP